MSPTPAGATAERPGGAAPYQRHRPEHTLLYQIVEQHYPAFVAHMAQQERPLPDYVQQEFEDYLRCGRLEHGFIPGILPSTLRASRAVQICSRQICHDHSQQCLQETANIVGRVRRHCRHTVERSDRVKVTWDAA